jgi:hypothetical protein
MVFEAYRPGITKIKRLEGVISSTEDNMLDIDPMVFIFSRLINEAEESRKNAKKRSTYEYIPQWSLSLYLFPYEQFV